MRAIILAAGSGLRLNGTCGNIPKCLLEVGGRTLLDRQIESLRDNGINEITVVVGFKADRVREQCPPGLHFIENRSYQRTNSLFSLWMARDLLRDGFVVMNSDVLFHPDLLTSLLKSAYEDALLVSFHHNGIVRLGEEEMKVRVSGQCVTDISKTMAPEQSHGENVGIAKFGPDGAHLLCMAMNNLIAQGNYSAWAPKAFQEFARLRPLYAVSTERMPWIEIDFPDDYFRAITYTFPSIAAGQEDLLEAVAGVSMVN